MKPLCTKLLLLTLFYTFCSGLPVFSQSLNYGDCVTDSIETTGDTDTLTFAVATGDRFLLRASSTDPAFGLCLEIRDDADQLVLDTCNAGLIYLEMLAAGTGSYSIIVSEMGGDTTGSYSLAFQKTFVPPGATQLECDSLYAEAITCNADMVAYNFSVSAGTHISLTAVAVDTSLHMCMELRDSVGDLITLSCGGIQAQVDTTFADAACFTVLVYNEFADTTGPYSIVLTALSGSCTNACPVLVEICDNSIDDDGDGLVDCADVSDCQPVIQSVTATDPSCPLPFDDGQISIAAQGANLTYSIDSAATYQADSIFTGLVAGAYNISVQDSVSGCSVNYSANPVTLSDPTCPEICDNGIDDDSDGLTDCDDPDCDNTPACPSPVTFDAGEVIGLQGDTVLIPVFLLDCDSMAVVQGTVAFGNPGILSVIGTQPGLIDPAFNPANNGFSYFDAGGNGIPVSNTDTLFFVEVVLTGNPGDSSSVIFVNSPVALQVVCIVDGVPVLSQINLDSGSVTILADFSLSGQVLTPGGVGIGKFIVTVDGNGPLGAFTLVDTTDANGNYMFSNIVGSSDMTITPTKDINDANGLSSFQLFLLQQFILGIPNAFILDGYDVVAGNANCDDNLSTFDLLLIQRVIVQLDSVFADCDSWVAAPATHVFPAPPTATNPFPYPNSVTLTNVVSDQLVDFIGMKTGDPLETADPQNLLPPAPPQIDDRSAGVLIWSVENLSVQAGQSVELPFRAKNMEDMASFQFELSFDAGKLEFEAITPVDKTRFGNVVLGKPEAGKLRFSWFSLSGKGVKAAPEELLFTLRFKAKENTGSFSNLLSVTPADFKTEARTSEAGKWDIELEFTQPAGPVSAAGFHLYQNIPNPAANFTLIAFDIPVETQGQLTIVNELGETVAVFDGDYLKGRNEVQVKTSEWSPGVYFYTLQAGSFTATKRMVLTKN